MKFNKVFMLRYELTFRQSTIQIIALYVQFALLLKTMIIHMILAEAELREHHKIERKYIVR